MSSDRVGQQLDRIESKVDRLDTRADTVDIRLEQYNAQLEIHVKRSDTLERAVQPVLKLTQFTQTGFKVLGLIAAGLTALVAIVAATAKLLGPF
jgi:tetrahydromethanopterin S-methyltransferase subunit B